jgi:hypothetical protein
MSSNAHLFIIIIALLIHHIEESELVRALARRDDTQPVSELLLLEELLRPVVISAATSHGIV